MEVDLETLNNKELHRKCMEYGISNVPVTDSTRKLLLRRLKAVITGKPTTTKKPKQCGNKKSSKCDDFIASRLHAINKKSKPILAAASTKALGRPKVAAGKQLATTTKEKKITCSGDSIKGNGVSNITSLKRSTQHTTIKFPKDKLSTKSTPILTRTPVVYTSYIQESSIQKRALRSPVDYIDTIEEDDDEGEDHNYVFNPVTHSTCIPTSKASSSSGPNYRTYHKSLGSIYNYAKPTTKFTASRPFLTSYRPRNM